MDIKTLQQLQEEFDKVYLFADRGVLPIMIATFIANQLPLKPVWLLIIGASSGGKTALIESLNALTNIVFPISDLTTNTFASGQQRPGKETSLLRKLKPGNILTFKDFTSLMEKNQEARGEIMGQLREIYDGNYVKRTGTGQDIPWTGKVGVIAGGTEAVYERLESLSVMGDRFIMYGLSQAPRMEVAKRAFMNEQTNMAEKEKHLQTCVKSYILYLMDNLSLASDIKINDELMMKILSVADFSTIVRSGVIMDDRKGQVKFVPQHEMPMRMTAQLVAITKAFLLMRKTIQQPEGGDKILIESGSLSVLEEDCLYKVAFSSIPIKRRKALFSLASYKGGITTEGLATAVGYQTDVVRVWLAQLNALGVCIREKLGRKDKWTLKPEYLAIMHRFNKIKEEEGVLDSDGEEDTDRLMQDYEMAKEELDAEVLEEEFKGVDDGFGGW